jgi:hypothetical protein
MMIKNCLWYRPLIHMYKALAEQLQQTAARSACMFPACRLLACSSATHPPACFAAFLPSCLPTYLPTCQSFCLLVCLPACLPAFLPAFLPSCLPAFLPSCLPACLLAYLFLSPVSSEKQHYQIPFEKHEQDWKP